MFSLENILQEIITFIKKFTISVYAILFKSPSILSGKIESKKLIKPSLYVLICMLFFLAFVQMNLFFIVESFENILSNYLRFLNEGSIEKKILYVFPMGITIYFLTYFFGRLLFKSKFLYEKFKSFSLYWIGTALLVYTVIQFINIAIMSFVSLKHEGSYKTVNIILKTLLFSAYIIPFVGSFTSLVIFHKKKQANSSLKLFIVPFFASGSILFCSIFLNFLIPLTELKKEQTIDLLSVEGTHFFRFDLKCMDDSCANQRLRCRIILQNKSKSALFVKKDELIYVKAYHSKDDMDEWGNEYQTSLEINKMNGDSLSDFKILKAGDFLELDCLRELDTQQWKRFIGATNKAENDTFEVFFQYSGNMTGFEEHYFQSLVKVYIDN